MSDKQKPSDNAEKDPKQMNELKENLSEIHSLLDLWDQIRTNPDGSLNEKIDSQMQIIAFGEEMINHLAPHLSFEQQKEIIEKLEQKIIEKYQQVTSKPSDKTYYQFTTSLQNDQKLREELQKFVQELILKYKD